MQIATTIGVVFPGIMHSIVILILLLLPFKIKKSSACILACLPTKVTLKLICFFVVPPFQGRSCYSWNGKHRCLLFLTR